jgi:uncharacterized protein (DUF433 family)
LNCPHCREKRTGDEWLDDDEVALIRPGGGDRDMPRLQDLEEELDALTPAEKTRLLQRIVRDLGDAFPGVESTPGVCGGEPCIVRTRIPVWMLEQMRRQGVREADILRSYPTLRAEDLASAWAYVRVHRAEIEQQIRDNEEA